MLVMAQPLVPGLSSCYMLMTGALAWPATGRYTDNQDGWCHARVLRTGVTWDIVVRLLDCHQSPDTRCLSERSERESPLLGARQDLVCVSHFSRSPRKRSCQLEFFPACAVGLPLTWKT